MDYIDELVQEAWEKGFEKAYDEAFRKSCQETYRLLLNGSLDRELHADRVQISRSLLAHGIDPKLISQCTFLPPDEVQELQKVFPPDTHLAA